MTFTSLGFLLFFPAVCLVWFCLPARVKPAWLLAASYWFYACADWRGPFLLAFTTVWSYAAARALASPKTRSRRAVLAAAVAVLAGLLALFKYLGFALQSAAAVLGLGDAERIRRPCSAARLPGLGRKLHLASVVPVLQDLLGRAVIDPAAPILDTDLGGLGVEIVCRSPLQPGARKILPHQVSCECSAREG